MPHTSDLTQPACDILLQSLQQAGTGKILSKHQQDLFLFDLELRCFMQQQLYIFNRPAISVEQTHTHSLNQPLTNLFL